MSHFVVYVITPRNNRNDDKIVEAALAKFQENNMGDCPAEYLKFNDQTDEFRQEYENKTRTMVKTPTGELLSPWDERFRKPKDPNDPLSGIGIGSDTHFVPDDCIQVEVPLKEQYPTFEAFCKEWHGHDGPDHDDRWGHWENPNAKWDWYQIGGRWNGCLDPKYDGEKNPINYKTCWLCNGTGTRPDFNYEGAEHDWARTPPKNSPFPAIGKGCNGCHGTGKQLIHPNEFHDAPSNRGRVEDVIALFDAGEDVQPFAFVTPDGEWIERGQMGWWAIVTDEKDKDTWKQEARAVFEKYRGFDLIVVDCHI